jgi:hypothetical protein
MRALLHRLKKVDLGYPLGANEVLPPSDSYTVHHALGIARAGGLDELRAFYASCDGVSLPDVHVGYFIKPVTKLGNVDPSSEPLRITGEYAGEVLPLGSDGGGGLFVLRRAAKGVLHLTPGPLERGVYDGKRGKVTLISGTLFAFLDRLALDLQAVVENQTRHRFMC